METRDGGHCYATVECKNGGKLFYKKNFELWDHCYVGGTTRFDDPRIGEFEYVEYEHRYTYVPEELKLTRP